MNVFKFYVKIAIIWIRALFFLLFPVSPNREGWETRVLFINLDLIGDMVMFTAVLKHYRAALSGKKLFLLISGSNGMSPLLVQDYVDEVFTVDTEAFKSNPYYGYTLVRKLRRIGFATVVEHNPGMQFVAKVIAVEIGAERTVSYQGLALDDDFPPSTNAKLGIQYFHRALRRKFTKIVPRITERASSLYLTHMIAHHVAIFESVTGKKVGDIEPELPAHLPSDDKVRDILSQKGVKPSTYALFALGSSSLRKEWPPASFAELGKILTEKGIPIVITGSGKDVHKSKAFVESLGYPCVDFTGKADILSAVSLVRFSLIAVSNDTAITHFAVAFRRPSLTIMYPTRPGWAGPYGYRDINRWVIREDVPCFGDNGQCGNAAGPNKLAPCMEAVTVRDAKKEFMPLLEHILSGASYPTSPFSLFAK